MVEPFIHSPPSSPSRKKQGQISQICDDASYCRTFERRICRRESKCFGETFLSNTSRSRPLLHVGFFYKCTCFAKQNIGYDPLASVRRIFGIFGYDRPNVCLASLSQHDTNQNRYTFDSLSLHHLSKNKICLDVWKIGTKNNTPQVVSYHRDDFPTWKEYVRAIIVPVELLPIEHSVTENHPIQSCECTLPRLQHFAFTDEQIRLSEECIKSDYASLLSISHLPTGISDVGFVSSFFLFDCSIHHKTVLPFPRDQQILYYYLACLSYQQQHPISECRATVTDEPQTTFTSNVATTGSSDSTASSRSQVTTILKWCTKCQDGGDICLPTFENGASHLRKISTDNIRSLQQWVTLHDNRLGYAVKQVLNGLLAIMDEKLKSRHQKRKSKRHPRGEGKRNKNNKSRSTSDKSKKRTNSKPLDQKQTTDKLVVADNNDRVGTTDRVESIDNVGITDTVGNTDRVESTDNVGNTDRPIVLLESSMIDKRAGNNLGNLL